MLVERQGALPADNPAGSFLFLGFLVYNGSGAFGEKWPSILAQSSAIRQARDIGNRKGNSGMRDQLRKPWVLILIAVGLMLVAAILLYATAPTPTVLVVQVVDAETGEPLAGADVRVRARSEQALPIITTDDAGNAGFHDLPSDRAYVVRVQKVDYDLAFEPQVAVPARQETQVTIPIVPHAGGRLFVGLDGGRVAQIDTASLLVIQTIRLSGWKQDPVGHVRAHPERDLLYAVAGNAGCILDSQSGASLAEFEVEGTVQSLSADGGQLYVISGAENSITIVRQSEDGSRVYVTATGRYEVSGQLLTLDAHTGELLTRVSTVNPQLVPELIWRPGDSRVYVVEPSQRVLWVLDVSPNEVLAHTPTGAYPKEGFPSSDGSYRYTWSTDYFEDLRTAFRTDLEPILGRQSLPVENSAWTLSPTGERLYLLDAELGTLSIVDLAGQEPPLLMAVGKQPSALALSPDGQWAYVANRESHTISVIYLPSNTVLHAIPVEGAPFSLAAQ